jgi:hypothetical protein
MTEIALRMPSRKIIGLGKAQIGCDTLSPLDSSASYPGPSVPGLGKYEKLEVSWTNVSEFGATPLKDSISLSCKHTTSDTGKLHFRGRALMPRIPKAYLIVRREDPL